MLSLFLQSFPIFRMYFNILQQIFYEGHLRSIYIGLCIGFNFFLETLWFSIPVQKTGNALIRKTLQTKMKKLKNNQLHIFVINSMPKHKENLLKNQKQKKFEKNASVCLTLLKSFISLLS